MTIFKRTKTVLLHMVIYVLQQLVFNVQPNGLMTSLLSIFHLWRESAYSSGLEERNIQQRNFDVCSTAGCQPGTFEGA